MCKFTLILMCDQHDLTCSYVLPHFQSYRLLIEQMLGFSTGEVRLCMVRNWAESYLSFPKFLD